MSYSGEFGSHEYKGYTAAVEREVGQLRVALEGAEAREKEREWLYNMTSGELDENKLVDGVAGDRLVYRRRGEPESQLGVMQASDPSILSCTVLSYDAGE